MNLQLIGMEKKILAKGAEAIIILEKDRIIKKRIKKSYRLKLIDEKLRKSRTKSEVRIMNKLSSIVDIPKIIFSDEKEIIEMEYIEGKKLSEDLEKLDYEKICKLIAENITKLHDCDIIHGDLTTSNMILKKDRVFFIDFGLSFHSKRIEDKAVDLHLFKQALEAKHFSIYEKCWNMIKENYKAKDYKEILERIKKIESRGRYKERY